MSQTKLQQGESQHYKIEFEAEKYMKIVQKVKGTRLCTKWL